MKKILAVVLLYLPTFALAKKFAPAPTCVGGSGVAGCHVLPGSNDHSGIIDVTYDGTGDKAFGVAFNVAWAARPECSSRGDGSTADEVEALGIASTTTTSYTVRFSGHHERPKHRRWTYTCKESDWTVSGGMFMSPTGTYQFMNNSPGGVQQYGDAVVIGSQWKPSASPAIQFTTGKNQSHFVQINRGGDLTVDDSIVVTEKTLERAQARANRLVGSFAFAGTMLALIVVGLVGRWMKAIRERAYLERQPADEQGPHRTPGAQS